MPTMSKLKVDIKNDLPRVQGWAREIVAKRLLIIGVITGLVAFGVSNKIPYINPGLSGSLIHWLDIVVVVCGWIIAIPVVRSGVTVAKQSLQPVNADGQLLVPAVASTVLTTSLTPAASVAQASSVSAPAPVLTPVPSSPLDLATQIAANDAIIAAAKGGVPS